MDQKRMTEYFDSPEFENKYHCDLPLGSFVEDGTTLFRLWAPTAQQVTLNLYHSGHLDEIPEQHPLAPDAKGTWLYRDDRDLNGYYYTYNVTVDGATRTCADPYAKGCGLNGRRSMVVNLLQTNPEGWEQDRAPQRGTENVIYEVHVKDFSWDPASGVEPEYRGKFLGLCQSGTTLRGEGSFATGMDYLKNLGVTHLELMPVYDYGSVDEAGDDHQFNWGYDPVNYNVPEGSYSTDPFHGEVRIRELKQTIQTLHANGFRVIMDVVYNHTYHLDSHLFRAVPWYYYRRKADGKSSNGSGCGNDLASERSMCAKYILDSVLYWASEYHIDGFRFDLMGLLPVELMNDIRRKLDEIYGLGEKLVFGEPWRAGDTAARPGTKFADKSNLQLLDSGVGVFCDSTRDAVKGSLMQDSARGFVNGGYFSADYLSKCIRGWANLPGELSAKAPSQTVSYLSCHDDWTLWDKLISSMQRRRCYTGSNAGVLRANRLAAAILFCCQGNLFLLSGEEFARTKNGIKNTYASAPEINRLDWNRAYENRSLSAYYAGLIALRKQLPGLCDKSPEAASRVYSAFEPRPGCAVIELDNSGSDRWKRLLLIVNTNEKTAEIALPMGRWQLLADGRNSFRWKQKKYIQGQAELEPVSALIIGLD